jgi:hypothetical protein
MYPMAKEADFYSTGEAAEALGLSERRVFSMLVSGELEGQQDEWARWRVPASAIRRARRSPEPSSDPGGAPEGAESSAAEAEARDDAATTIRMARPLWEPPDDEEEPIGEETPQKYKGHARQHERQEWRSPRDVRAAEGDDSEITQRLPYREVRPQPAVPGATFADTVGELAEGLAVASAAAAQLQAHLKELTEVTDGLREGLERERRRADRENAEDGPGA